MSNLPEIEVFNNIVGDLNSSKYQSTLGNAQIKAKENLKHKLEEEYYAIKNDVKNLQNDLSDYKERNNNYEGTLESVKNAIKLAECNQAHLMTALLELQTKNKHLTEKTAKIIQHYEKKWELSRKYYENTPLALERQKIINETKLNQFKLVKIQHDREMIINAVKKYKEMNDKRKKLFIIDFAKYTLEITAKKRIVDQLREQLKLKEMLIDKLLQEKNELFRSIKINIVADCDGKKYSSSTITEQPNTNTVHNENTTDSLMVNFKYSNIPVLQLHHFDVQPSEKPSINDERPVTLTLMSEKLSLSSNESDRLIINFDNNEMCPSISQNKSCDDRAYLNEIQTQELIENNFKEINTDHESIRNESCIRGENIPNKSLYIIPERKKIHIISDRKLTNEETRAFFTGKYDHSYDYVQCDKPNIAVKVEPIQITNKSDGFEVQFSQTKIASNIKTESATVDKAHELKQMDHNTIMKSDDQRAYEKSPDPTIKEIISTDTPNDFSQRDKNINDDQSSPSEYAPAEKLHQSSNFGFAPLKNSEKENNVESISKYFEQYQIDQTDDEKNITTPVQSSSLDIAPKDVVKDVFIQRDGNYRLDNLSLDTNKPPPTPQHFLSPNELSIQIQTMNSLSTCLPSLDIESSLESDFGENLLRSYANFIGLRSQRLSPIGIPSLQSDNDKPEEAQSIQNTNFRFDFNNSENVTASENKTKSQNIFCFDNIDKPKGNADYFGYL